VTAEAMQRTNWIVPGLEVNISPAMLEAMRIFAVRGPLWKQINGLLQHRLFQLVHGLKMFVYRPVEEINCLATSRALSCLNPFSLTILNEESIISDLL